jgi:hypothetical protein
MNPASYYHSPPKPESTRARCPVCQQSVYSLAGIHPQCAERQADPPRPKSKAKGVLAPVNLAAPEISGAVVKPAVAAVSPVSARVRKPFTSR